MINTQQRLSYDQGWTENDTLKECSRELSTLNHYHFQLKVFSDRPLIEQLVLPRAPRDLLRQIGTYVSGSSKRCAQLETLLELLIGKKKEILRTCSTRWLSLKKCFESVLNNWDVLLAFFKQAAAQDKLKSTEFILFKLSNECRKIYLYFLKYVLNYFNMLNALFQSKAPLIQVLQLESVKIFLDLRQNFIKATELNISCAVRSPHVSLPFEDVFLGHDCNELINKIPIMAANRIRMDCVFYITALEEIQRRLPLKANILNKWSFYVLQLQWGRKETKMT